MLLVTLFMSRRLVLESAIREGMQLRARQLACLSWGRSCLHCGKQAHKDWVSSSSIIGADPGASTQRKMHVVLVE